MIAHRLLRSLTTSVKPILRRSVPFVPVVVVAFLSTRATMTSSPSVSPYGSWKSPISSNLLVEKSVAFECVQIDHDGQLFVSESRPEEKGRTAVCTVDKAGQVVTWTPLEHNVRTRVHEYGGVAYYVHKGRVFYTNFADQHLYVQDAPGSAPKLLVGVVGHRFAGLNADPVRARLVAVREDHTDGSKEAVNTVVAIDINDGTQHVLASGADFYSGPVVSHDGKMLAWSEWNHPNLPWDDTSLKIVQLDASGMPIAGTERLVAGGHGANESAMHPYWTPSGDLIFTSDRTDWWNVHILSAAQVAALFDKQHTVEPTNLTPMPNEFVGPQWVFSTSPYTLLDNNRLVVTYKDAVRQTLALLDLSSKQLTAIETGFSGHGVIAVNQKAQTIATIATAPNKPQVVMTVDVPSGAVNIVKQAQTLTVDAGYLSIPRGIKFKSGDHEAYGYFYPPTNKDFVGPESERPPLLVKVHGGPTASCKSSLSMGVQYFTSRGFAVFDCNYAGSTGYGRKFRQLLYKNWGVYDLDDCVNGALYLARETKEVDENRLAIDGNSAGGYTTLAVLAFRTTFKAGCSNYGVSDLGALALETHKFESRYLDNLIGPYPAAKDIYDARSPIHHVDGFNAPLILFQGDEDKVVPPSQAQLVFEAVKNKGIPVAYRLFPGEQHGFRKAANIRENIDGEFGFYTTIFDIQPADAASLPKLEIHNWPQTKL